MTRIRLRSKANIIGLFEFQSSRPNHHRTIAGSGHDGRGIDSINPDSEVGISDGRFLLFTFNLLNYENTVSLKFRFVPLLRRSFSNPSLFPA